MQHVNFYPWRGARYDTGINNKRILILGESHYCEDSDKSQKSRHKWWKLHRPQKTALSNPGAQRYI